MHFNRVYVEITNICGLACSFCPPKVSPPKTMSLEFFQKSIPEPTEKNFHTQLGVHFEEVSEMVDMLTSDDAQTIIMIDDLSAALTALGNRLKSKNSVVSVKLQNRVLFLDGIWTAGIFERLRV